MVICKMGILLIFYIKYYYNNSKLHFIVKYHRFASNKDLLRLIYFWRVFASLSTLYRSYQDGYYSGQRKPVHTVGQGSVL